MNDLAIIRSLVTVVATVIACGGAGYAQVLIPASPVDQLEVRGVDKLGKITWFASSNGLWYSYDDSLTITEAVSGVDSVKRGFLCIKALADGSVWAGGNGLYEIRGEKYYPTSVGDPDDLVIDFMVSANGQDLWLGTENFIDRRRVSPKSYLFRKDPAVPIAGAFELKNKDGASVDHGTITALRYFDDANLLWISTANSSYLFQSGSLSKALPLGGVTKVVRVGEQYYFMRSRGNGTILEAFPDPLNPGLEGVLDIAGIGQQELWFSLEGDVMTIPPQIRSTQGTRGEFKLPNEAFPQLGRDLGKIKFIDETQGYRWLISKDFVLLDEKSTPKIRFRLLAMKSDAFNIRGILEKDGAVWLWGESGLYRFFEEVSIRADLNTTNIEGETILKGDELRVENISYVVDEKTPPLPRGEFSVLLETNRDLFDKKKYDKRSYKALGSAGRVRLRRDRATIFIGIRDQYGNYSEQSTEVRRIASGTSDSGGFQLGLWLWRLLGGVAALDLLAILLFVLSGRPSVASTRGRLALYFFSLGIARTPPVSLLLSLQYEWVRRRFYSLYRMYVCETSSRTSDYPDIVVEIGKRISAERKVRLEAGEASKATVEAVKKFLFCDPSSGMQHVFPLLVLGESFPDDVDIKEKVVDLMVRDIEYSFRSFCKTLLERGLFVFLVLFDSSEKGGKIERAVDAFFDANEVVLGRDRNYLLKVPVSGTQEVGDSAE